MLTKANSIRGFVAMGIDGNEIQSEVYVYMVAGHPKIIGGKNSSKKIEIAVEGLEFPFSGFINTRSSVLSIIEESIARNEMVCLRFEQQRKKEVEPDIPIKELRTNSAIAKEKTIKKTVGIYDYKNQNFILTKEAQTDPNSDSDQVKNQLNSFYFDVDEFFSNTQKSQEEVIQNEI